MKSMSIMVMKTTSRVRVTITTMMHTLMREGMRLLLVVQMEMRVRIL